MTAQLKPIVIVTGANSGVGFGICHRFLLQLAQRHPPDCFPQDTLWPAGIPEDLNLNPIEDLSDGITIILACRSLDRAQAARTRLLATLDKEVIRLKSQPTYDGHAERFRSNVELVVLQLDLASMRSVFDFCKDVQSTFPYISHIICNAAMAALMRIDWRAYVRQCLKDGLVYAFTYPEFNVPRQCGLSDDGLGLLWQCNIFSHYCLTQILRSSLEEYCRQSKLPARILWVSSIETKIIPYEPEDWQLLNCKTAYRGTKYQIDIVSSYLDEMARKDANPSIRHLLFHPGAVITEIQRDMVPSYMRLPTIGSYYLVRFLGSRYHNIDPLKSGIAATHLSLARLESLPLPPRVSNTDNFRQTKDGEINSEPSLAVDTGPPKFASGTTFWGHPEVLVVYPGQWEVRRIEGERLVEKMDRLYQAFRLRMQE